MSDKSTAESEERKQPSDAATEALVAAERRRMIDRVLTYAALREQAAVMLDEAAIGHGPEKPSEGSGGARTSAGGGGARHRALLG